MIQLFFIHFYFLVVPAATDPMLQRTTCFPCCHLKYFTLSHFKPVFFWNTLFFIVPFFGNSLFAVPLLLYSFFNFLIFYVFIAGQKAASLDNMKCNLNDSFDQVKLTQQANINRAAPHVLKSPRTTPNSLSGFHFPILLMIILEKMHPLLRSSAVHHSSP